MQEELKKKDEVIKSEKDTNANLNKIIDDLRSKLADAEHANRQVTHL